MEALEQAIAQCDAEAEKRDPDLRRDRAGKRRANRGELPSHLPQIEVTLSPEDTKCPCCRAAMTEIGLGGYRGILECDGYAAYKTVAGTRTNDGAVTLAFCWSHVRRGFYDLAKAWAPVAIEALRRIGALYKIEERVRGTDAYQPGGRGKIVEIDGWYFGEYVKPANHKENRRDLRACPQSGARSLAVWCRVPARHHVESSAGQQHHSGFSSAGAPNCERLEEMYLAGNVAMVDPGLDATGRRGDSTRSLGCGTECSNARTPPRLRKARS